MSIRYVYFVSYRMNNVYRGTVYGNCEVERAEQITRIEDIKEIEKLLMEEKKNYSIVVTNFQLLRKKTAFSDSENS